MNVKNNVKLKVKCNSNSKGNDFVNFQYHPNKTQIVIPGNISPPKIIIIHPDHHQQLKSGWADDDADDAYDSLNQAQA